MNTITIRSRHRFAGIKRDATGLWVVTTLGWWTWQTAKAPEPVTSRIIGLIGDLMAALQGARQPAVIRSIPPLTADEQAARAAHTKAAA